MKKNLFNLILGVLLLSAMFAFPAFSSTSPKINLTDVYESNPYTDKSGYLANKLVDGDKYSNKQNKWFAQSPDINTVYTVIFQATGGATALTAYEMTTGGDTQDYPNRNPSSWKIYGKNASTKPLATDTDWTLLVNHTSDDLPKASSTSRIYSDVTNSTSTFNYFKFECQVSSIESGQSYYMVQLNELELYNAPTSTIHSITYKDGEKTVVGDGFPKFYIEGVDTAVWIYKLTKQGYEWGGWYTSPTGGTLVQSVSGTNKTDVVLFARYEFDANLVSFTTKAVGGYSIENNTKTNLIAFGATYNSPYTISNYGIYIYKSNDTDNSKKAQLSSDKISDLQSNDNNFYVYVTNAGTNTYYAKAYVTIDGTNYFSDIFSGTGDDSKELTIE